MEQTPGPWEAIKYGDILHIFPVNRQPFDPKAICGIVPSEADAALIAAAPELLEELKHAHAMITEHSLTIDSRHSIRSDVIRRAEGR